MKHLKFIAEAMTLALACACGKNNGTPGPEPTPGPAPEPTYVDGSTVINGRNALDLGTDLLWADVNIGASASHEYGDYFAWGEIEPKKEYNWANYKWGNGYEPKDDKDYDGLQMEKYCMYSAYGKKDGKSVLEPEDDAATQLWKDGWRMPTKAEVDAIISKCDWEWYREKGFYGWEISSKTTSKRIFIPAAGCMSNEGPKQVTTMCNYWAASLFVQNEQYYSYSYAYDAEKHSQSFVKRYLGFPIRPVHDKMSK